MIVVEIAFNTYADGTRVDHETIDWEADDAPIGYYGPFEDNSDAESFIINDYPDGDTDVFEMEIVTLPDDTKKYINNVDEFRKQFEEDDIRTDPEVPC